MPITETDALGLHQALTSGLLDEERQKAAALKLQGYADERKRQGLSLFPSIEKQRRKQRQMFYSVIEDPKKLDAENGIYQRADAVRPGGGDNMRAEEVTARWMAEKYQLPVDEVRKDWKKYAQDYGARNWNEAVVLEAPRFLARVQQEAKAEKQTVDTINTAADEAMKSALRGGDMVADWKAWEAANPEAPKGARKAWEQVQGETLKRLGPDGRAAAMRTVRALQNATGTAENADGWWNEAKRDLVAIKAASPGKYRMVLEAIKLLGSEGPKDDKGLAQGAGESFARSVEHITRGSMSALEPFQARLAGWGVTNADDPKALAAHIRAGLDVDKDMLDLANGAIDPITPDGWLESGVYMLAGSLPYMLSIVNPLGQVAVAGSFSNDAYHDFKASGWEGADAEVAAVASGTIQAAVELLSEVTAKIPGVGAVMAKYGVGPGTNWLARFMVRSGVRAGAEFTEEVIQQATTPFIRDLAGAILPNVPETPEGQKLKDVMGEFFKADNFVPLLISVLPLGMIGAGLRTAHDKAIVDLVTKNDSMLRAVFSEEDAAAIAAETDPAKRQAMIENKWVAMPTEEMLKRAKALDDENRKKTADAWRAITRAEQMGMIPEVRRGQNGWTVTQGGKTLQVQSRQEAIEIAYSNLNDLEFQSAASMAQVADEFMGLGNNPAEAFEISKSRGTVKQEVDVGRVTPEQAAENVEVFAQMHGLTAEEARAERLVVLGNNRSELVEGVRTAISRIFGDGNLVTVLHEGVHGRWRPGLESGHYTPQQGLAWVRMAEQATGVDFLATKDDSQVSALMLDEAIAEVASANIISKRKDQKQHFTPGLISRGIAAFALSQRADAKEAGKFLTFLKAWKEFWGLVLRNARKLKKARAEGKLGEDFDAFLDDLLGADAQQRHEGAAAKEAVDLVDTSPFSLAPKKVSGDFFQRPGVFYRVIVGADAFQDILQSGEVRTNAGSKTTAGASLAEKLAARPTAFPSFSKDSASMSYAQANPNHFIIVTTDSSIQPSTAGRHSAGKTHFPTDAQGNHLKSLSASKVSVYRHIGNDQYRLIYDKGNAVSTTSGVDNAPFSLAQSRATPADTSNVVEMPDGAQMVGPTLFSITAYHGTPHKVDKFSLDKIGTGEGAQAYGWGLYFAAARAIAEYYQKALTDNTLYFNGKPLLKNGVMIGSLGDAELDDWFYHGSESYDPEESAQSAESDGRPDIAAKIRALIPNITKGEPGNLYTVELLPDEADFLDWDKPLSEQSEKVQQIVRAEMQRIGGAASTGERVYRELMFHFRTNGRGGDSPVVMRVNEGAKAVSEHLASLGIPGIRYLDGNSRDGGSGTSNYVIFDESLVKILEENGRKVDNAPFSLAPRITSTQDADYLAAVKAGDMETAQRMVDEAAKAADVTYVAKVPISRLSYGELPGVGEERKLRDGDAQPLIVERTGSGDTLALADGYHRLEGMILNGETEVTVIILNSEDSESVSGLGEQKEFRRIQREHDGESADPVTYDSAGNVIPLSQRFNEQFEDIRYSLAPRSQVSAKTDAEYMAAVEAKDILGIKKMLNQQAQLHGLIPAFVSVVGDVTEFNTDKNAIFLTDTERAADSYASGDYEDRNRINVFIRLGKSQSFDFENNDWQEHPKTGKDTDQLAYQAQKDGFESVVFQNIKDYGNGRLDLPSFTEYVVFSSNQIKSADAITRDNDGNIIPLSRRFDSGPDVRGNVNPESTRAENGAFSLAPRSLASVADTVLASRMKSPEFRDKFYAIAREKLSAFRRDGDWRVDKFGNASRKTGADSFADRTRTVANIERERKFRQRSRQRELIEQGMNGLTNETRLAYETDLMALEDQPLIASMLNDHGRLMSWKTANEQGRIDAFSGDYDGAPWLPPAWYAKGGGIMPDVMAQYLYDDGHLAEPTTDALWSALSAAIEGVKLQNDAVKKAVAAVREVEKTALRQSKEESEAWAKAEKARIPTAKERQMKALRTLDALLSAFPPEIRGRVGGFVQLAALGTDKAREAEIERRITKLDEVVESEAKKHYGAKIGKMLKRYKSQKDSSGRISGKLISTATEQVDYAAQIADLDVAAQAEKGDALESLIEKSDDAGVVQDALNKLGILRMFETMDLKDSLALESAADWLETTIADGKLGKKIVDESRKEFVDDMRQEAQAQVLDGKALNIDDANNLTNVNRAPMLAMVQRLRGMMSEALWTTAQRLEIIFGEGSKASEYFAAQAVAAANKSNDIKRAISAQQREILGVIFGSDSKFTHAKGIAKLQKPRKSGVMVRRPVTKDVTLDMETLTKLADGTMTPETAGIREDELQTAMDEWAASDRKRSVTITQVVNAGEETNRFMSELQGIQWRLWWNQADSKKQMERDGWSEESIKQLDAFLSDEAKALGEWISDSYGEAAKMIDPVYRRLFNAPLPRIKGYAPIYRMTLSTSADVMDLGNSDMNSGLAAGFTKSRVNTTAPLLEIDALAAFLSHWENVSHWVSHAELMRDMKAILLDKNVSTAIRQKKGDGALLRLKEDVQTIEKNGTNSAKELVNLSRGWRWLMQYRAYKGLAFRLSPIVKQASASLNPLLADVPAHNYAAGLSRALTSPQEFAAEVAAMWKSDVIRRRIEGGFSTEARIAQQGASMTGSQAIVLMQAGMMPMAQMDGAWTAMGAAVAFDWYRRGYLSQNAGATPAMADRYATARLERMIATSAQPSDIVNRSLVERSTNPFMRSLSMFVSDQRKALAIEALAIRKLVTGKSKNKAMDIQRVLVAHFIQAAVTQTMAGVLASTLGDDDDEDREWSLNQWALALTLGPVNGLFVFGRLIDKVGRTILGLRIFPGNDLAGKAADDLIRGTKSMDELFNPDDAEDVMTSLDALSSAAGAVGSGMFGPAAGVVDVSANFVREVAKIAQSMMED